jgi:hypothetical protein
MFFQTVSTKQSLKQNTKIVATVSPAVHYMTFEMTALIEKLTFQPALNV